MYGLSFHLAYELQADMQTLTCIFMLQNVLLWENNTFANELMCKKCCPTWPTFCTAQLIYFLIFFLVPNPVQNLRVADVQAREITIQWDYPFGPSEFYQVEYYILDSEDHGRPIDTGVTEFSHNRLFPYTTYVYKVYNIVNGVIRSLPQRLEVTTLADGKLTNHSYLIDIVGLYLFIYFYFALWFCLFVFVFGFFFFDQDVARGERVHFKWTNLAKVGKRRKSGWEE